MFRAFAALALALSFSSSAFAGGFFSPYSDSYFDLAQFEKDYMQGAFAELEERIKLAESRFASTREFLSSQAEIYEGIGRKFKEEHKYIAAQFYFDLSNTIRNLPEQSGLAGVLSEIKAEREALLAEARSTFAMTDISQKEIQDGKVKLSRKWHDVIKKYGIAERYFSEDTLKSQDRFNAQLLTHTIPLFGGRAGSGYAGRITLDSSALSQVSAAIHNEWMRGIGFLTLAITVDGTINGHTYFRMLTPELNQLRTILSVPQLHAIGDSEAIAVIFEGTSRADVSRPLHVRLVDPAMPWWTGMSREKPKYDAAKHQLTIYYGAYKGDWGSTRYEVSSDPADCANILRRAAGLAKKSN